MAYPFTLPDADFIRIESRLRPEQVDASYPDIFALIDDIQARIPGAADVVMMKLRKCAAPYLWPLPDELIESALEDETPDDVAEVLREQLSLATQATAKKVESGLYFTAGQLNDAYKAKGIQLSEECNALINTICSAVQYVKDAQASAVLASTPSPRPRSRILVMTPRI